MFNYNRHDRAGDIWEQDRCNRYKFSIPVMLAQELLILYWYNCRLIQKINSEQNLFFSNSGYPTRILTFYEHGRWNNTSFLMTTTPVFPLTIPLPVTFSAVTSTVAVSVLVLPATIAFTTPLSVVTFTTSRSVTTALFTFPVAVSLPWTWSPFSRPETNTKTVHI